MRPYKRRVFDTNVLVGQWRIKRQDRHISQIEITEVSDWATDLIRCMNSDAIVTPVRLEFLAGTRDQHESNLAEAYLEKFQTVDGGMITPLDWSNTARRITRIPRDGRPRHLIDCLILSICDRLRYDVLTSESRFGS
jgi:hypothetical protein